ncbi:hypothetical protein [Lacticaseibacillus pantheris]|uniref:hypothetical protein n=1 Tax=Lacticaseibacillus pantheris TaxID=171523 RepID=UPI00265A988D|nr:hypothetical protein [Lacticaseibacillus pantheris]WKF86002.1 hypothetical protein QY874_05325 [Lacticaseibacillus pantheris]
MKKSRDRISDSFSEWYDRGYNSGHLEGKLTGMYKVNAMFGDCLDDRISKLIEKMKRVGTEPADQVRLMTLYEIQSAVKREFDNFIR